MSRILATFSRTLFSNRSKPTASATSTVRTLRFLQWLVISLVLSAGLHAVTSHLGGDSSVPTEDGNGSAHSGGNRGSSSAHDAQWWQPRDLTPPASSLPSGSSIPDQPEGKNGKETSLVSVLQWHGGPPSADLAEKNALRLAPISSHNAQEAYQILGLGEPAAPSSATGNSSGELHFSLSGVVTPGIFYISSSEGVGMTLLSIPEPSTVELAIMTLAAAGSFRWRLGRPGTRRSV